MTDSGRSATTTTSTLGPDLQRAAEGSSYSDAVRRLLAVVRTQLGMDVAWVSEFVGSEQVLRFVDGDDGVDVPREGSRLPLGGSFCARVLDGRFPALIPDARQEPEAALLDVTAQLHIGAYVGVPLVGTEGVANGMLCAINERANPGLSDRDVAALQLMAALLHDLQQRAVSVADATASRERQSRLLRRTIGGEGRYPVLQPIVDIATGRTVAAEGLTRFDAGDDGSRSPAQWFADAGVLGLRTALEVAAASAVLDLLDSVPSDVALTVNLAPETLLSPALGGLLDGRPLSRVVVEVTEHAPVLDYGDLVDVVTPYRDKGLRLAVDDAGAGYASLRHVLAVRPDLVKVDMVLVRGADVDAARRTLLTALASFSESMGAQLVAEGVETQAELEAVASCGVHLAQGYHLGRPTASPSWSS